MTAAEGWTIGAVARRAGLRTSAIRYYETIGLLPPPIRVSGSRRYDPDVLPRLALIAAAQRMGFTIAEIATLMHGFDPQTLPPERWRTLAAGKLIEVEALIARAQGMKQLLEEAMHCGCLTLDACARALADGTCATEEGAQRHPGSPQPLVASPMGSATAVRRLHGAEPHARSGPGSRRGVAQ